MQLKDRYMTAMEIKRELIKRTGQSPSLSQIGRIGKKERLRKYDRRLGFALFDGRLVDVIIDKYL